MIAFVKRVTSNLKVLVKDALLIANITADLKNADAAEVLSMMLKQTPVNQLAVNMKSILVLVASVKTDITISVGNASNAHLTHGITLILRPANVNGTTTGTEVVAPMENHHQAMTHQKLITVTDTVESMKSPFLEEDVNVIITEVMPDLTELTVLNVHHGVIGITTAILASVNGEEPCTMVNVFMNLIDPIKPYNHYSSSSIF